jgi:hypothetical protein
MSFDTPNISSVRPTSAVASSQPARAATPAAVSVSSDSVTVDTMPAAPPPEVLDAIGAAASAYDRLTASGVQLHFHVDEQTGKVSTQVYDTRGTVLGTLSPSQVLDVATTGTLD